jgi:hypothetical protein
MVFIQRLRVEWRLANYNDLGAWLVGKSAANSKKPARRERCGFGIFWW